MSDLMKAKIYKQLADQYASLWNRLRYRASNVVEYTKEDEQHKYKEFVETIVNQNTHDKTGILSNEDRRQIELLEYFLDDEEAIK